MVSVIIPAHNAEKTIERAVVSAAQLLSDSEIIVVENGSEDATQAVVKKLQKEIRNLILIFSDSGVSKARNAGLACASGEWILFLDADDYLEKEAGPVLNKCAADRSADLWLFGHHAGSRERSVTDGGQEEIYPAGRITEARVRMLHDPTRYMQVWGKLFQHSIIRKENLKFDEQLTLSEDSDFTLRYTRFCKKICFSPCVMYHYSVDNVSAMRQYDGTKAQRYVRAMQETGKKMEGEEDEIRDAFRRYVLMHMNIAMVREIFAEGNRSSAAQKREQMAALAGTDVFAEAIADTKAGECRNLRMLPILFLKKHLYRPAALIYRARVRQNARRQIRG